MKVIGGEARINTMIEEEGNALGFYLATSIMKAFKDHPGIDNLDMRGNVRKYITLQNIREIREKLVAHLENYLSQHFLRSKIHVICDERNNPPSIIDNGRFVISVEVFR